MNELELILKELAGVTERLTRMPKHDYAERARLQSERERLRAAAAKAREQRTTAV
jgi:hypothetical protein